MTAIEVVHWIDETTKKSLLLNHNLHSAYLTATSPDFARLYENADCIVIDGAPILWLARRTSKRKLRSDARIGSTDWLNLIGNMRKCRTIAVFGASRPVNSEAVARLQCRVRNTGATVVGLNGYERWDDALLWLREAKADLVIIGLGMPRQEEFLTTHWDRLPDAVYATVGGAIDYVAGANKLSPRWIGALGLEWLWRLVHEPRRLGHRYLIEPFLLATVVARRKLSGRRRGQSL